MRAATSAASPLAQAYQRIATSFASELSEMLAASLHSLASEPDETLLMHGIEVLAKQMDAARRPDAAAALRALLPEETNVGSVEHAERLLGQFVREATDLRKIVPIMAGSIAFQAGRFWTMARMLPGSTTAFSLMRSKALANLAGFGAEVATVTTVSRHLGLGNIARPWLEDFAGNATTLGALRLAGWGADRALPPRLGSTVSALGRLGSQFAAMVAAVTWTSESAPRLDELAADFLAYQFGASLGSRFNAGMLAQSQAAWRTFEVTTAKPFLSGVQRVNFAGAGSVTMRSGLSSNRPLPKFNAMAMKMLRPGSGIENPAPLPTPSASKALQNLFRSRFPGIQKDNFSEEIISSAVSTPSEVPGFHAKLLEAYVSVPNRGSLTQFYTARAIEYAFLYDALHTSTGSVDNLLLQHLIVHSLSQDSVLASERMAEVLQAMEHGLTRQSLESMILRFEAFRGHELWTQAAFPNRFWSESNQHFLKTSDLFNGIEPRMFLNGIWAISRQTPNRADQYFSLFREAADGAYPLTELRSALAYAEKHPLGLLLLRRILNVLSSGDIPAKIAEISDEVEAESTIFKVLSWSHQGLDAVQIAGKIDGTRHTAYIRNQRLAKKITDIYLEVHPILNQREIRRVHFRKLDDYFSFISQSKGRFNSEDLVDLLQTSSNPTSRDLDRDWKRGHFSIELVDGAEFDHTVSEWKGGPACTTSLFLHQSYPVMRNRILIRQLPLIERGSKSGRDELLNAVLFRLTGLLHEYEHWRHFIGDPTDSRGNAELIEFGRPSREERLVSEMLSFLEEQRWYFTAIGDDYFQVAKRLGENWAMYQRNYADRGYFGRVNTQSAIDDL